MENFRGGNGIALQEKWWPKGSKGWKYGQEFIGTVSGWILFIDWIGSFFLEEPSSNLSFVDGWGWARSCCLNVLGGSNIWPTCGLDVGKSNLKSGRIIWGWFIRPIYGDFWDGLFLGLSNYITCFYWFVWPMTRANMSWCLNNLLQSEASAIINVQ